MQPHSMRSCTYAFHLRTAPGAKFSMSRHGVQESLVLGQFVVKQVLDEMKSQAMGGVVMGGLQVSHLAHLGGALAGVCVCVCVCVCACACAFVCSHGVYVGVVYRSARDNMLQRISAVLCPLYYAVCRCVAGPAVVPCTYGTYGQQSVA